MKIYRIHNQDNTVVRIFEGGREEALKLADQMGRVFNTPFTFKEHNPLEVDTTNMKIIKS